MYHFIRTRVDYRNAYFYIDIAMFRDERVFM